MVGIPRSRACKSCRARRKKCDEQKPVCGLCIKRGVECVYKTDLNIVYVNPGAQAVRYRESSKSSSPSSTGSDQDSLLDLPPSCLASAVQLQIRGTLAEGYLSRNVRPTASSAWLYTINEDSLSDPLLDDALRALSLSCLEHQDASGEISHRSREVYGRTIKRLNTRLETTEEAMADTTLAAVMILLSFEAYTATQQNLTGWFSHAKGASQLVKMRGNKNASSGIAQQLYLGSRMWQLICGIGQRKAITNAAAPPPQTYTGLFASYSMLFDILFTMLAIMEEADIVNAMIENTETQNADSAISILSYMFQNFESNLDGWYDQLLQNESNGDEQKLFWLEHSNLSDQLPLESPQRVYLTYMHFQNLDIGEQLILYWGFSLLTHLLIYKTELNIRSRTSLTISLYSTDASRQASLTKQHLCADRITQSLEYFLNYGVGAVAVSFLGVPMNVAFGYWAQYDLPQRRWFDLIFERLRATHRGYGSLMAEMAQKGGGGEGFRAAIGKTPKAELNTERLRSNLQRSQYTC